MKRFLFAIMCAILMIGCTNDNEIAVPVTPNIKSSEVMVFCKNQSSIRKVNTLYKKTEELGYSIPKDGTYDVWYYIRIDGNIPGEKETQNVSNQYFPQTTAGKTIIDDLNHGTVHSDAAWSKSVTKNFPLYLYDADGSDIQDVIITEPILNDLLEANKTDKYDLSGYVEHQDELHFIWYTCKQQASDHIWHIDGVLTSKDRVNLSETIYGSNIEVDIHQQNHSNWNEIKTSIHLRDTVEVEVVIPIESEFICKADDFDIRLADMYEYVEDFKPSISIDGSEYEFITKIDHKKDGIHILIKPNTDALKAARKEYDDGITFEIHSFVSNSISTEEIWEKLMRSTCKTIPSTNIYKGEVSSAFYTEKIKL